MLIVFEGIDGSGKTTLSKEFSKKLNEMGFNSELGSFSNTFEPTFGTEQADLLNTDAYKNNEAKRETFFLQDRLKHQQFLTSNDNIICDRYAWSGLAYASVFSPKCLEFCVEIYNNEEMFRKPDVYVFVDTSLEICQQRRPDVEIERLEKLERAYFETLKFVRSPIIRISNERPIEEIDTTLDNLFIALYLLSNFGKGVEIEAEHIDFLKSCVQNLDKVSEVPAWRKPTLV